ncbi:ABC transporter permease [Peterkaempfera griseoplana]|uniref:ABC transporter permease n=1 Tax=Peterkaempfera griseoplana TaxID=66896 RepID=UPI0006E2846B|nr:ABC transporter permease [Peterkaempfera griseoplana]
MRTIFRRLGFYVLAAYAAVTLNFFLVRMLPGDALQNVLSKLRSAAITPEELKALAAQYGLDSHQSLASQYFSYLGNLLHGDLGTSTSKGVPVTAVLGTDLPWTIGLVGSATVIAFVFGTLIGIVVGWRRSGFFDALLPVATFFQAVPYFILAFLLLLTLGFYGKVFPYAQGYDTGNPDLVPGWNGTFITSVVEHGALPAATVALASIAGWIIGMRNVMLTTMDEDYVLVAAAKGLPQWKVAGVAARNAILPSISNFALSISLVVAGSIATEIVFSYPGLGYEIYQAILTGDYPLMQGILLVVIFTVLGANLLADMAYVALDPRARKES